MVITVIKDQVIDIEHICFIRAGDGPIYITHSREPRGVVLHMQAAHWEPLNLLSHRPGGREDVLKTAAALEVHHIRNGWFAPSPEVLDHVAGVGVMAAEVPRRGGRRLSPALALEIFRMCHETSTAYRDIGRRFGVGTLSVGKVARAEVYAGPRGVLRREDAPGEPGVYYVREARDSAPRYRMYHGRRGTK